MSTYIILNEDSHTGSETGAGLMRNRCAFTSRDMGAAWPEAFAYAIVFGWDRHPEEIEPGEDLDGSWRELAEKHGWDDALIAFLRDAHERFAALPDDHTPETPCASA